MNVEFQLGILHRNVETEGDEVRFGCGIDKSLIRLKYKKKMLIPIS